MRMKARFRFIGLAVGAMMVSGCSHGVGSPSGSSADGSIEMPLKGRNGAAPAPLCGIALWQTNPAIDEYEDAIALEFSYFYYSDVASDDPAGGYRYDWSRVDDFLAAAKSRGHHGILRFRDTDPELGTARKSLPDSLWANARQADYDEGIEGAAKKRVVFPDWSNPALADFVIAFYRSLAERYPGQSSGIGYLEIGFGLWAEYHIDFDNLSAFSPGDFDSMDEALGFLFPSRSDQRRILREAGASFRSIPWGISIDSADTEFGPYDSPLPADAAPFGLFDDSLLHGEWQDSNRGNWEFYRPRLAGGVNGGEFSYYSSYDQEHALDASGPHGLSLARAAAICHLSFVIGDGQTDYHAPAEIAAAGKSLGYALEILSARSAGGEVELRVRNGGVAVVSYDIRAAFGSFQSAGSLKGLLPGQERFLTVTVPNPRPEDFRFVSPALLSGQEIPYAVP